jgi:RNase P subunit RPR2
MGGQLPTIRYYSRHLNEATDVLQVLCANCNWKKSLATGKGGKRKRSTTEERRRDQLIMLLGGSKCSLCGENDSDVITLDQRDGGGTAERKKRGSYLMMLDYYFRNPNEAKSRLRVLCRNCNWRAQMKRYETRRP